jgi:lysophospholipase L1-like esterase
MRVMRIPSALRLTFATLLLLVGAAQASAPPNAPVIRARADGMLEIASAPAPLVRYTLDGSDPGRDAGVWLAPVELPGGYTLKARAFAADGTPVGEVTVRSAAPTETRRPSTLVPVTQNRDWRIYDWAERHAACVALMRSGHPEIVMLGDSITHFWGGEPVSGRRTGVAEWDRFFAGRRVVNLGYGWDRTENVLWRITHGEFDHVSPRVVVVMIGTNNIDLNTPGEIAGAIREICAELHRRAPATRILLLGIFPRGASPDATRAKVASVNQRIAPLDGHDGVTYLDIGGTFLEADGSISRDVMYDYLHPTAAGYVRWTAAMEPTLTRLLGR